MNPDPTAATPAAVPNPTSVGVSVHLRADTVVFGLDISDPDSEYRRESVSIHIGDRPAALSLIGQADDVERVLTAALTTLRGINAERKLAAQSQAVA